MRSLFMSTLACVRTYDAKVLAGGDLASPPGYGSVFPHRLSLLRTRFSPLLPSGQPRWPSGYSNPTDVSSGEASVLRDISARVEEPRVV